MFCFFGPSVRVTVRIGIRLVCLFELLGHSFGLGDEAVFEL